MIHENTRYLNEPWKIFRELSSLSSVQSSELAKIMAVSGECYWRRFHFIDEHASGLLEENKQTLNMNMLMSYVGTESVGKSQSFTMHWLLLWDSISNLLPKCCTCYFFLLMLNRKLWLTVWAAELCTGNNSPTLLAGGKVSVYLVYKCTLWLWGSQES